MMSCAGFIYLLQPLLSITNNDNVFKIGKTHRNNFKRFFEYPNGSNLLLQRNCINCDTMERKLLVLFNNNFIKRKDYGMEYFEGDYKEMIKIIIDEIDKESDEKNDKENDEKNDKENEEGNKENDEKNGKESDEKIDKESKYSCNICNYNTTRNSDLKKHLLTEKHIRNTNNVQNNVQNIVNKKFECNCGNIYKFSQGLSKHKKICNYNPTEENPLMNTRLLLDLIKKNQELQNLLIEKFK